jgi:cytochrome c5
MRTQATSFLFLVIFMAIVAGTTSYCTYDNEVDLYGPGVCDTVAVKYNTTVANILSQNCSGCHSVTSTATNKPMDTYLALKPYIIDGSFGHSIKGTGGYVIMPPSGPLNNCQIEQIEAWIKAGYPQ